MKTDSSRTGHEPRSVVWRAKERDRKCRRNELHPRLLTFSSTSGCHGDLRVPPRGERLRRAFVLEQAAGSLFRKDE
ncbi:hypothetical protein CEXT_591411 [Caerostris extrusa]|uniref:Uncharacterized protein n=1 Tax=Caerostris extrusa TaxID=172846 RepID=A0AAV4TMK7_CAEEX|nr:hypothetical protein CEXT_591411 [Caerostris extrusa]